MPLVPALSPAKMAEQTLLASTIYSFDPNCQLRFALLARVVPAPCPTFSLVARVVGPKGVQALSEAQTLAP
tara:strand:+ start:253 stop:465 length:213 start_codon:yes stop_codon:yes gene_type:complete